jgi:transcriptional regulator with XRE-family HTH domain
MVDLRKKFGKRLQTLRRQSGLTQEQLAQAAQISVDFLSLVERGINAPSFENLEKLAKALGVPIRELFNFENNTIN